MIKMVTIGGGSSYTPEIIEGLINRYNEFPVSELWLVDVEEGLGKLEIVTELARRMVKKANIPMKIIPTLDRREALKGADFVTTQLRVGFLDARVLDEEIPFSHGVLGQETNGAGGLFKALRTVPVILDIAHDVHELCPNAWMINFTNPSGIVTEALLKYSPHKRVLGLCNVPIHMEHVMAQILDVDNSRLRILFGGLNHMVFGLKVYLDGEDITKRMIDIVTAPDFKDAPTMRNIAPVQLDKTFVKELGVLTCPYHNYFYHAAEMLQQGIEDYQKNGARAKVVKKVEADLFELYKDENLDIKPPQLELRGGAYYSDAACELMCSIYNDKKDIQTVDTRNNGAIWGIDDHSAVEVSAVITKEGAVPLTIGRLPIAVQGLVSQIKSFETLAVEAAVEGSYEKALVALTINPLIPSDKMARILLDEMLEAHKKYLPRFFNQKS